MEGYSAKARSDSWLLVPNSIEAQVQMQEQPSLGFRA